MIRCFTLFAAAYALLAIESSLNPETAPVTPYGSFVWMLLPWLATLPSSAAAILAAAAYGLMLDAFSNYHPGLLMAATIGVGCALRGVVTQAVLASSPGVFVISFVCGVLMAMLVAVGSILTGTPSADPAALAGSIATSSAFAAILITTVVAAVRSVLRTASPVRSLTH